MNRDPLVEQYLAAAQSWELDRALRAERSARGWRVVAAVFAVIAILAVIAVAGLTPLKQPIPYVIRVNDTNGLVDVVPMYEGTGNVGQVVSRQLLNSYVISRERYFYGTAEADYELVAAQNSPLLNQELLTYWDKNNPQSPLNLYKDGTTIRVQVKAISFLKLASGKENVAQVRFSKHLRAGGSGDEQTSHWIATMEFTYVKPSTDDKLRSLNPLGFRVIEYRREPEVVGALPGKGA
jgi:type IV secretion system protein VirB8